MPSCELTPIAAAGAGRLGDHIVGWDAIEPIAREFDLPAIARVTGITVEDIERIAVELASANSAICYGRTGLSMQEFGGLPTRNFQAVQFESTERINPEAMVTAKAGASFRQMACCSRRCWSP